ncbi:hypothetical protein ACO2Q8_03985 [Larkinella sp. VNQ87]|uniref:hypothetical protein n=1 Tax=Larkinella sp. VNQ87 TaxID=3400921 RepID=UPI003C0DD2A3
MNFTKLVPSVFYTDIQDALKLFVDCLEFTVEHHELHAGKPFYVIGRDRLQIYLFENEDFAQEHHPELRLVTDDIEAVYQRVATSYPEFLHPNLSTVTLRPWGAKEFALMDSQLGIIIQQWS